MGMVVTVDIRGPVLTGRGPGIVEDFVIESVDDVAQVGFDDVNRTLRSVIRNPTPYYWTRVINERQGSDRLIHDQGVIYGPWLEGVGSRNRTTRFKGYATFRTVKHRLRAQVESVIQPALSRCLNRLRG